MKKILIITYYWPPSGGAGVQRWLKFCKYLPEFGYEPIVLTVDPEFASYPVRDESFLKEVDSKIKVVRTKSFEPLNLFSKLFGATNVPYSGFSNVDTDNFFSKASRWVRGNFFIPDARKFWVKYALKAAERILDENDISCVVTTGPPHSTHLIGLKLKQKQKINWVADFRDPWTDIYYYDQLMLSKSSKAIDLAYEDSVFQMADKILTVCPSNFDLFKSKRPSLAHKLQLISNGYDEVDFSGLTRGAVQSEKLVVAYMGTIASTYNVKEILSIFSDLQFDWELRIAGVIAPDIQELISQLGIEKRIVQLGYLPHKEALQNIYSANLLLHIVPDIKGTRMGTTGKLFEYIGCGVPIINFGHLQGDSARFIEESNSGKSFDRSDRVGALNFISEAFSGNLGLNSTPEKFTRRNTTQQLVNSLNTTINSNL